MYTINDLTVSYDRVPVLEHLNLEIKPGTIHGLVGLNGSGKTTLFHAIYGITPARSGEVLSDGKALKRKDTALLETQNYFYSRITGREYLALFPSPGDSFDPGVWQDLFKLPLDEEIETYSTGMKKKLALTGILKTDKSLLLLDEPFNGVDLETAHIIKLLLLRLREKGKTVLVTSHVLETLTGCCDLIHFLENKGIKKTYSKDELGHLEQDLFRELEAKLRDRIKSAL